jgi:hypothetical protein
VLRRLRRRENPSSSGSREIAVRCEAREKDLDLITINEDDRPNYPWRVKRSNKRSGLLKKSGLS